MPNATRKSVINAVTVGKKQTRLQGYVTPCMVACLIWSSLISMNYTPSSWETNSETVLCGWVVCEQISLKCHRVPHQLSHWLLCLCCPIFECVLSFMTSGNEVLNQLVWTPRHRKVSPSLWVETHHLRLGQNTCVGTRTLSWTLRFLLSSWIFSYIPFFLSL